MMEDNESCITTNVVSPVLHSLLLLPKLRETSARYNTLPRYVHIPRIPDLDCGMFQLQTALLPFPLAFFLELLPRKGKADLTLNSLVFVTSFVHWMTQFPERQEEKFFEALADEQKSRMDDRYENSFASNSPNHSTNTPKKIQPLQTPRNVRHPRNSRKSHRIPQRENRGQSLQPRLGRHRSHARMVRSQAHDLQDLPRHLRTVNGGGQQDDCQCCRGRGGDAWAVLG